VKAEAFASGNRRSEEVDLGRIQAGRPEGRPLLAAEWDRTSGPNSFQEFESMYSRGVYATLGTSKGLGRP
jgi:hypothetical protein